MNTVNVKNSVLITDIVVAGTITISIKKVAIVSVSILIMIVLFCALHMQ